MRVRAIPVLVLAAIVAIAGAAAILPALVPAAWAEDQVGGAPASSPPGDPAASPEQVFKQANALYDQGNFDGAIEKYRSLIDSGYSSAAVQFNLGNAFFKKNQIGRSILYYEKALKLEPADPDARANLSRARKQAVDLVPETGGPIQKALRYWLAALPFRRVLAVAVAAWIVAWAALAVRMMAGRPGARTALAVLAVCAACAAAVFGSTAYFRYHDLTAGDEAVILTEKVDLRSGPGPQFVSVAVVHEGLKVTVRNRHEGWDQVTLPNGLTGWMPATDLGSI